MTYYDYISLFAGIGHPFGDLATDIKSEVGSREVPDELLDIYEGESFSDIFEHLRSCGATSACIDTFVESWAAYKRAKKQAISDPIPALILFQLTQLNKGLSHLHWLNQLDEMNCNMDGINESLGDIQMLLFDMVEYKKDRAGNEQAFLQIAGMVDTYEQNA